MEIITPEAAWAIMASKAQCTVISPRCIPNPEIIPRHANNCHYHPLRIKDLWKSLRNQKLKQDCTIDGLIKQAGRKPKKFTPVFSLYPTIKEIAHTRIMSYAKMSFADQQTLCQKNHGPAWSVAHMATASEFLDFLIFWILKSRLENISPAAAINLLIPPDFDRLIVRCNNPIDEDGSLSVTLIDGGIELNWIGLHESPLVGAFPFWRIPTPER